MEKDKIIVRVELLKILTIFLGLLGASIGWLTSFDTEIKLKPILVVSLVILLILVFSIIITNLFSVLKMLKEFR
jgi:membrane protein YdbS with pleckstrin-like domain